MPRQIPDFSDNLKMPTVDCGRRYDIELITPLFGGGVETRTNDRSFPIRPTAIRGQLQFWWRATVGAAYATKEELRDAQSALWGCTEQASRVQVLVVHDENAVGPPVACARFDKDNKNPGKYRSMPTWNEPFHGTALPYALFPFQGQLAKGWTQIEVDPARCITRARFRLIIRCPDGLWPQVEPAIWAWINFGGLGSRTRRGCGAISGREVDWKGTVLRELAPEDTDDLAVKWKHYMPRLFPDRAWPTIAEAVLVGEAVAHAIDAWDEVIAKLRFFRQGTNFARDPGSPPSRSRYPEPDTIRRITDSWKIGHEPREQIPDGFPRAEFGLPIVFHFKEGKKDASDTWAFEPYETVLQPFFPEMTHNDPKLDSEGFPVGVTGDRMASPLILKPVRSADGRFIPIMLRLCTMLPDRVELQNNKTHQCLTPRRAVPVRDPGFASGDSPIHGRSAVGSVLEAFLAYAAAEGFREVTR